MAHLRVGHRVLRQSHALGQSERHRRIAHARGDGGAQRVVGVVQKHRVRRGFESARDAVLDTVDLAHAIQLVAEQVEQHHVAGLQMRQYLRQPQLVALEHAQSDGFACRRAVATPESRFAPVRLHTTRWPACSRMSASRFVTVVLPFVPTTTNDPLRSFGRRSAMRRGSTYSAILPGKFAAGRWKTFFSPQVETALTARAAAN